MNINLRCECTHSKKSHADKGFDDFGGRCCAVWQLKDTPENKDLSSLLRFCECMEFRGVKI